MGTKAMATVQRQTFLAVIAVAAKTISFVNGTVTDTASDTKVRFAALHWAIVAAQGTLALVHSVHSLTAAAIIVWGIVLHTHASSMWSPRLILLLVSVVISKILVLWHRVLVVRTMRNKSCLVVCLVVVICSG